MLYYWNGIQIWAEEVAPDEWEAWLEYDDEGPRGTGSTELAARADLRNTLTDQARNDAAMWETMKDDKGHAMAERRVA